MFSVIKYTLPRILKGDIQSEVLRRLLKAMYEPNYGSVPELIVVTDSKIENLDPRVKEIVLPLTRYGHFDLYQRIAAGLSHASNETIFLAEHDVLYPKTYFVDGLKVASGLAVNQVAYNMNALTVNQHGYFNVSHKLLSNLAGKKSTLATSIKRRIEFIESGGNICWAELGMGWNNFTDGCSLSEYRGRNPCVDIRYGNNLTGNRISKKYHSFNLYWGRHKKVWQRLGLAD